MIKAAVYKCSYCKYEQVIPLIYLHAWFEFDEDNIATYPKTECDCCHKTENPVAEVKEFPDEEFPEFKFVEEMEKKQKKK